jgi:hypothetical protein
LDDPNTLTNLAEHTGSARQAVSPHAAKPSSWPWLLSYPGVLTVAAVVAAIGVAARVVMLHVTAGSPATDRPARQFDAIR